MNFMMMTYLAQVAGAVSDSGVSPATVGTIIGAVVVALIGGGVFHGKNQKAQGVKEQRERDSVTISNTPLGIKMEDHFVTRREFDNFKSDVRLDIVDLKGVVTGAVGKMDERDKRYQDKMDKRDEGFTAKMEAIAAGAYEARRRIHEKVNDQGERLKSLEDRTPVKRPSAGN